MVRVLMLDDDPTILRTYARTLKGGGHEVDTAVDGIDGIDRVRKGHYDVIFSDISMPGMNGFEFLKLVRGVDLDVPIVLMTGDPSVDTAIRAIEYGAFRYLPKPVAADELCDTATRAAILYEVARVKRDALQHLGAEGKSLGDRASLESRFESALEKLWMAYQPIVAWPERALLAYEALVRSDESSLARPLDLIDAAERLGRLPELGRAIRAAIAADIPRAPKRIDIYVNLHARDLQDEELFSATGSLTPVAERVVLEITERAPLNANRQIEANVAALRTMGFRLAVDDLGTGYAGLTSLIQLEPEVLKIDMSLIRGIDQSTTKQRIVGSILKLAKQLGKKVIAEGVETIEERDMLHRLDCHIFQGYLFSKPERGFLIPRW